MEGRTKGRGRDKGGENKERGRAGGRRRYTEREREDMSDDMTGLIVIWKDAKAVM